MAVEIQMPAMGESVTEGTVLEWHVSEGDSVSEGDTVVEVSTDKVDAEVPAPADGTISKLLVDVDDVVQVGAALAELEPGENGASGNGSAPAAEKADEESDAGEVSLESPAASTESNGSGTSEAATSDDASVS